MSASTLPGDIPGLLRRGSPFRRRSGIEGVVIDLSGRVAVIAWRGTGYAAHVDTMEIEALPLDLTDPTGRVHAQWWAWAKPPGPPDARRLDIIDDGNEVLTHRADDTPWWTTERISLLAEVVLRLAGRWP